MPQLPILVATRETQGQRPSDFCFAEEGEVVTMSFTCDRDARSRNPDSGCGCGRSLSGALSHKATTTFRVALGDFTPATFIDYYLGAMQDTGWLALDTDGSLKTAFTHEAQQILRIAAGFPVGTVLEKRLRSIQRRTTASQQAISETLNDLQ